MFLLQDYSAAPKIIEEDRIAQLCFKALNDKLKDIPVLGHSKSFVLCTIPPKVVRDESYTEHVFIKCNFFPTFLTLYESLLGICQNELK
jgi:hypothetical protein